MCSRTGKLLFLTLQNHGSLTANTCFSIKHYFILRRQGPLAMMMMHCGDLPKFHQAAEIHVQKPCFEHLWKKVKLGGQSSQVFLQSMRKSELQILLRFCLQQLRRLACSLHNIGDLRNKTKKERKKFRLILGLRTLSMGDSRSVLQHQKKK